MIRDQKWVRNNKVGVIKEVGREEMEEKSVPKNDYFLEFVIIGSPSSFKYRRIFILWY